MSHSLRVSWSAPVVVLAFLIFGVPSFVAAQPGARQKSRLGEPAVPDTTLQPQFLNPDTNPTLRFPIAWASQAITFASFGWLDLSHNQVQYTPVQSPPPSSATEFSGEAAQIRELRLESNHTVTFRLGWTKHTIFYVPQERWGARGSRALTMLRMQGASGTRSIFNTMINFEAALASVTAPGAPLAPRGTEPPVPVTPPAPEQPPASPAIVLISPSGGGTNQIIESQESSLVIRGVATDSAGILVISINGSPANMRPQSTQAAEFWSDALPLKAGNNHFEISATNSAHAENEVAVTVHYASKAGSVNPKALDKAEIVSLLEGAVPSARVTELVNERGVKFVPTTKDLDDIRSAGGDDPLIQAIQQAVRSAP
jgi:hypothetical protein